MAASFSVLVGTTSQQVLGAAPKRKRLTFYPHNSVRVTLSPNPPAVLDQGLTLQPGQTPTTFTADDDGGLVTCQWYAIAGIASTPIAITETMGP